MSTTGTAARTYTRPRQHPEATRAAKPARNLWPPLPVGLLLATLVMPWVFSLGSMAVSPYRLALLALTVPSFMAWLSGKAGRIRAADILLFLFCTWCTIAMVVVHGPEQAIESGGMLFIETFGAYLVARCYIRTVDDFRATARFLFLLMAFLLPLALAETVTRTNWTQQLFGLLGPTITSGGTEPRWGLTRVQGPFEHPILFGVFCGAPLALVFLAYGQSLTAAQRWAMTAVVGVTAMLSLSSGPMVAVVVQIALLAWNALLRNVEARWRILWVLVIVGYLALELPTSQSVPQILTRYAFDPWTAFYRILIFDYGWHSVMAHPLFGTGFGEWLRPAWMSSSIDMFWLVPAVRHGLPAGALCMAAFFVAAFGVGRQRDLDAVTLNCRIAYVIVMTGFFLVGLAVHFWNATYVLVMFLLGSGLWIYDAPRATPAAADEAQGSEPQARRRQLPSSRQRPSRVPERRPARRYARGG